MSSWISIHSLFFLLLWSVVCMDAGFTPPITTSTLLYNLQLHSADWKEQVGYLQQWRTLAIHLKDFHPVSKEVAPVLSLSHVFYLDVLFPTIPWCVLRGTPFSTWPNTHWTVRLRGAINGGKWGQDILVDWAVGWNENAHWAITACLLWIFFFFLYFYFISFLVLCFPVLPGGRRPLSATAQRVCFQSNGMFVKWLTLENINS